MKKRLLVFSMLCLYVPSVTSVMTAIREIKFAVELAGNQYFALVNARAIIDGECYIVKEGFGFDANKNIAVQNAFRDCGNDCKLTIVVFSK